MEDKKEEKKMSLFREKSLETVESPESLNDYLCVTSPGVWLVLSAVIMLLVGCILWSIFGRITTTGAYAVSASDGACFCYVPFGDIDKVMTRGVVTVEGKACVLDTDADCAVLTVSELTDPYIRVVGKLQSSDYIVEVPVNAVLDDGVYEGEVVLESLQPISLLLQ